MLHCSVTHLFKHSVAPGLNALLLIHVHQGLWRVGSGHRSPLLSPPGAALLSPVSVSANSVSTISSPLAPAAPATAGRATAGSAELAETESKLFNDNDDLDKHNNNDSSALGDS